MPKTIFVFKTHYLLEIFEDIICRRSLSKIHKKTGPNFHNFLIIAPYPFKNRQNLNKSIKIRIWEIQNTSIFWKFVNPRKDVLPQIALSLMRRFHVMRNRPRAFLLVCNIEWIMQLVYCLFIGRTLWLEAPYRLTMLLLYKEVGGVQGVRKWNVFLKVFL